MNSCNNLRYTKRSNNDEQIKNFSNWWHEQLNQYGTLVNYYTKGYSLSAQDPIYGEDFSSAFESPKQIIIGANITNDASMLSKFGIVMDSDMEGFIHFNDFKEVFGQMAEPKSGDVIELVEVGLDRPGGRGAPKYEITEREDDDFPAGINPLMGHFLWYLKFKRFEFSHEEGIAPEPGTEPVDDQDEVEDESEEQQGDIYEGDLDSVYGSY